MMYYCFLRVTKLFNGLLLAARAVLYAKRMASCAEYLNFTQGSLLVRPAADSPLHLASTANSLGLYPHIRILKLLSSNRSIVQIIRIHELKHSHLLASKPAKGT